MTSNLARILVLAAAAALAGGALAQDAFDPTGKYQLVRPPQPTDTPEGTVEVVDVFWYGCPHCWRFLPVMETYMRDKPDYVVVRRMPAVFRESWENHARAFYTAQLLDVEEKIHRALFEAIHVGKQKLDDRESLMKFFESHGVDPEEFARTFDSFAVESLVRKSKVMQGRYGVEGTPSVIVAGKYRTSGSNAGSYANVVKVVEALAEKEHQEQMAAR